MEVHSTGVPDTYMALFPHLLAPVLWERPGNIPPLVRLIQAFIIQGANQIEAEKLVSCWIVLRLFCYIEVVLILYLHNFLTSLLVYDFQ